VLLLVTVVALLLATLAAVHAAEVSDLLARCRVTKSRPTPLAQAAGYGTMSQCLLLGNGNLMVSVAGGPETITLFLGKTDFWRDRGHGGSLGQSGNVLPGWVNLTFPAMADAQFAQVQDMALAEVQTKLTKGGDVSRHINVRLNAMGFAGPFRGGKHAQYEGGIRIPFIIRWPGHVPAGRVDERSVISGADWLPTLCALTGTEINAADFDGEDASAAWQGKGEHVRTKPLLWKTSAPQSAGTIREGQWKLHHPNSKRGELELFDVVADPGEQRNLVKEHPDIVKRLSAKMQAWQATLPKVYDKREDNDK